MVVNWYLAEKLVVNWELGTPISTLFWLAPSFSSRFEFQHGAFASETFARPKKTLHCRLGIFGIGDLNNIHCGIQKNTKYLDGKRDLTATREAGFTKIWTRDAGNVLPVCREFEECGNCESTRRETSGVFSAILAPTSFLPLFAPASSY